ncbi:hypothetical protein JOQ06_023487, partial [Pogonophryne albipinna]
AEPQGFSDLSSWVSSTTFGQSQMFVKDVSKFTDKLITMCLPTSQTRKQPDVPRPKAKGKQESTPWTAESKQGREEIYISQSG